MTIINSGIPGRLSTAIQIRMNAKNVGLSPLLANIGREREIADNQEVQWAEW